MRPSRVGPLWTNPVIRSVIPVVDGAQHVRVNEEAFADIARWMAYEEFLAPGQFAAGPQEEQFKDEMRAFLMLVTTIDFAFTDFETGEKFTIEEHGITRSDSDAMVLCLQRAHASGIPILTGAWMASVTVQELESIFSARVKMPLLQERAHVLNQVGHVLCDRFQGSWDTWFASCEPYLYANGNGLLERIESDFETFRDEVNWRGHRVLFRKLPQLALWMVHNNMRREGQVGIKDMENATAFPDYILPMALEILGAMRYTPDLKGKIEQGVEIPANSDEEIEIRACTIYCVTRLTEEINALRPAALAVMPVQVDYRLWLPYHASHAKHHLTRTTKY